LSASPHGNDGHGPETDVPQQPQAPETVAPGRRRIRDQIGRRSRLIAVVLSVSLLYVIVDIFVHGPLTKLDVKIEAWDGQTAIPQLDSARSCWSSPGCSRGATAPGARSCSPRCRSWSSTWSSAR
jgi:hypothetical protein